MTTDHYVGSAADRLLELGAAAVLVLAAERGLVDFRCAMPECCCPEGRTHFERRQRGEWGHWAPSPDRWPVPRRDGGKYVLGNVRLSHRACNTVDGARAGIESRWAGLTPAQRSERARELAFKVPPEVRHARAVLMGKASAAKRIARGQEREYRLQSWKTRKALYGSSGRRTE